MVKEVLGYYTERVAEVRRDGVETGTEGSDELSMVDDQGRRCWGGDGKSCRGNTRC